MGFTILLVEDDLDSRYALTLLLEMEGIKVIAAPDGLAALTLLEAHHIDLIITDICMPGMSGIELTAHIRASAKFEALPIIAITAAAEQAQQTVLDAGANVCLAKPIELTTLLETANRLPARDSAAVKLTA